MKKHCQTEICMVKTHEKGVIRDGATEGASRRLRYHLVCGSRVFNAYKRTHGPRSRRQPSSHEIQTSF